MEWGSSQFRKRIAEISSEMNIFITCFHYITKGFKQPQDLSVMFYQEVMLTQKIVLHVIGYKGGSIL